MVFYNRWFKGILPGYIQSAVCGLYVRTTLVSVSRMYMYGVCMYVYVCMYVSLFASLYCVCSGMHAVGLALNALLIVTEMVTDDFDGSNRTVIGWLHAHKRDSHTDSNTLAVHNMFNLSATTNLGHRMVSEQNLIHTYIHTYIGACLPIYINTCIHTYAY